MVCTINGDRYGLITEQKKGVYRYFADMGDRMEVVASQTSYIDEACLYFFTIRSLAVIALFLHICPDFVKTQERQREVDKTRLLYGMELGVIAADGDDEASAESVSMTSARKAQPGSRVS